ncbi:MAG: hypothetical protein H6Q33_4684 [Deltaproteobacteria bacterium]|jgi:hypothetical protein|nr:hypothetical protein [Deltaproteobacteria bacterium]
MTEVAAAGANLRQTIVMVRWALLITCSYLILFSEGGAGASGAGPLLIAVFLASNLVVGRLPSERLATREFKIGIAVLDTVLISSALYLAQQLSAEVLLLFLAVVVLAAAGLELGVIARITLLVSVADVLLIWLTSNQSIWRSSMLLRVPFLLSAGLLYGALVEAGLGGEPGQSRRMPLVALDALTTVLVAQREAIARCQAALGDTPSGAVLENLNKIANQNQEMHTTIARL